MAIKKSIYTAGNARKQLPNPYVAGSPSEIVFTHVFTEAVASTDILELCYLPAYCRLLSCEVVAVGTSTTTFDVGFMSGDVGSTDSARTVGAEIFNDVTPTTQAAATLANLAAIATSDVPRSIGIQGSADVAASANTKLHVRMRYATGT